MSDDLDARIAAALRRAADSRPAPNRATHALPEASPNRRRLQPAMLAAASLIMVAGTIATVVAVRSNDPVLRSGPSTDTASTASSEVTTAAPTSSIATSPSPLVPETSSETSSETSVPLTGRDTIVLRGDGLGLLPFGSAKDDVVDALTSLLGTPGMDAGPPSAMVTPGLNGCTNLADTAMMFPELVVGFSDHGDGPVLTSWAANINGRPIDPAGLPPPLATTEGLSVGDMTADAETIYGSAFHQDRWTPTLWSPYLKPVGKVDSAGGTVVLINLQDDDRLDMLTAGIGCDLVPMQLAPTGPTTGDSPIGLHFMTILIGEEDPSTPESDQQWVIIDTSTGQQTRWHYLGGRCDPGSLCVTLVSPSDSGQPVMLWATYEVERNPAGTTVWEVTDTFEVPAGTRVFGSWDCGAGVPLSTADDTVVTALLSVDPATGAFVTLPVTVESCARTH